MEKKGFVGAVLRHPFRASIFWCLAIIVPAYLATDPSSSVYPWLAQHKLVSGVDSRQSHWDAFGGLMVYFGMLPTFVILLLAILTGNLRNGRWSSAGSADDSTGAGRGPDGTDVNTNGLPMMEGTCVDVTGTAYGDRN